MTLNHLRLVAILFAGGFRQIDRVPEIWAWPTPRRSSAGAASHGVSDSFRALTPLRGEKDLCHQPSRTFWQPLRVFSSRERRKNRRVDRRGKTSCKSLRWDAKLFLTSQNVRRLLRAR